MFNPLPVLALISDLYSQLTSAQEEIGNLKRAMTEQAKLIPATDQPPSDTL